MFFQANLAATAGEVLDYGLTSIAAAFIGITGYPRECICITMLIALSMLKSN